jgi:hypothetical protein
MEEERTIVIDLRLSRGFAAGLLCVLLAAVVAVFASPTEEITIAATRPSPVESGGMRQFYLAGGGHLGAVAKTACASGYHMASLWEIADPSNLKYNTTLGYQQSDSGEGPPADEAYVRGWVRTGYTSDSSTIAGRANCFNWGTSNPNYHGSTAALPSQWTSDLQDLGVWQLDVADCDTFLYVWCIED